MIYGVLAATVEEIRPILSAIKETELVEISGQEFYEGYINHTHVIVGISGIGKVNAAIATQNLINMDVDLIVNVGVAGLLKDVDLSSLLISSKAQYHDYDLSMLGYHKNQVPDFNVEFESSEEIPEELGDLIKNQGYKFLRGKVCTGDQFISSEEKRQELISLGADAVDMEAAAIAQVCTMNAIPFILIKNPSDKANDIAHESYKEISESILGRSAEILRQYLWSV